MSEKMKTTMSLKVSAKILKKHIISIRRNKNNQKIRSNSKTLKKKMLEIKLSISLLKFQKEKLEA